MSEAAHDASGHRARLRERLLRQGEEALGDHELVEYLLALAIPRRDTKPLARALLAEFGGLERLMSASPEALMRQTGMGETSAAAIKAAQAIALRLLRKRTSDQPLLASWDSVIDYLRADMAHIDVERVRILYLDTKNRLIRDEVLSEGTVDQAAVHVRAVIGRAMQLAASALILVHNHPSGDPTPSRQDIRLTKEIADAGRPLGILVHDHVIVAGGGHASLRSQGLI